MRNFFIFLSSILALTSYGVFIVAILKGYAKPQRMTRFILVLISGLATASLFAQESTVAIWLPGIFTLGSLIIFLLSLKFGMGGLAKTDGICLILSIAGIVFWKITHNPLYALYASIAADFVGQIPMFIKTYRFPGTEVWTVYLLSIGAAICNLIALQHWFLQEYAYSFYIILTDSFVVVLILRPKFFPKQKNPLNKHFY